ncbi:hypothetical protein OHAE_2744 [Ochrobactrum soli]|uniref:Uncharacterized protein n=1 Tax=Ochrobactrum soli TaxID=2448455 RepID=A0A2P9HFF2_9HYPH|nr:hypothetical protein OHAE_2744 [[Ochrobactrum] soli]
MFPSILQYDCQPDTLPEMTGILSAVEGAILKEKAALPPGKPDRNAALKIGPDVGGFTSTQPRNCRPER